VTGVVLFGTMPLTVGTPVSQLPHLFRHMISNRPTIGTWGWSGVWVTQHPTALSVTQDPLWLHVGQIGGKVALLVGLLAVFWWRRGHPLDVATVSVTAFIVVSPGFGTQYLQWPVPSSTVRPTRLTLPVQIVAGLYAATLYLPMNMLTSHNWHVVDQVMMFISLGVVVLMIAALPWGRRVWDRSRPDEPEHEGEGVPALDTVVAEHGPAEVPPPDAASTNVPRTTRPLAGLPDPADGTDSRINR
jgi:hypothetical protein